MISYDEIIVNKVKWRLHYKVLLPVSLPHGKEFSKQDLVSAFRSLRICYLIRWESNFDSAQATSQWWHVIKDAKENLESLSSNTRSKIRRGKRKHKVSKVDVETIIGLGYKVYSNAYSRYDTIDVMLSEVEFKDKLRTAPEGMEYWAVWEIDSGELVAFSEVIVESDACFYLSLWFGVESLKNYVSYVLIYEMNCYYLNEIDMKYVTDGARSISHESSIHDFLIDKFRFRKAYCDLNIAYSPSIFLLLKIVLPFRRLFHYFGRYGNQLEILCLMHDKAMFSSCVSKFNGS